MRRLAPRSLYGRMLALSGVATVVALLVAGWVIAGVLERFVVGGLDRQLDAEIIVLASAVDPSGDVDPAVLRRRAGLLDGGRGWRWRVVAPGGTFASDDFPALAEGPLPPGPVGVPAPPPPPPGRGPRPLDGTTRDGVALHARQLIVATRRGPATITTAAPRDVIRRPIVAALSPLLASLGALAVLLGTASLLGLRVGLRPLRSLRDQVGSIRTGRIVAVDEDQPSELQPLASEINALLRDNAAALMAARLAAANLAHALKTPLTALALRVADDPDAAALTGRMSDAVRHHLARARAQAIDHRARTAVAPAMDDLLDTVRRLHAARTVTIASRIDPDDLAAAVDPHDFDEMVGNLLDNAAKFCRAQVTVTCRADPADLRSLEIVVEDDGPGIPTGEQTQVLRPGMRLDERPDGYGFGLAIVAELVTLYAGSLRLENAADAGLRAHLVLPRAVARP